MHVIITHVYICPKTRCTARKMVFFITSQDPQTQVLAGDAIGNHHNNGLFKMHDFRDHCYRQSVLLLLFVIILRTI